MRSKKIVKDGVWYSISSSLAALRRTRQTISQEKFSIARRATSLINKFPWIRLVAVTGALAMDNADEHDDIDLMIVTEKNRLWIARPIVMFLILLFFKRRKPNLSINAHLPNWANSICLNLWLDESALEISASQQNLYTAHELAQMKPMINKGQTYERVMSLNSWGRKYLANVWKETKGYQVNRISGYQNNKNKKHFNLLTCQPVDLLNIVLFNLQFWYMRSKMTTERVSLHNAFFHPGNRARAVLRLYKKTLDKHKIDI